MIARLRPVIGAVLLFGVLVLPNHPDHMGPGAVLFFPWELPAILLLLLALGRVPGLVTGLSLVLVVTAALKLADYGTYLAYARPFDPVLDLFLIQAGLDLLFDSTGALRASALVAAAVAGLLLLFAGLWWGLGAWAGMRPSPRLRLGAAAGAVLSLVAVVADTGHHLGYWRFEQSPPGTAWTTRLTLARAASAREVTADLVRFRTEARTDDMRNRPGLLDALDGRDVYLIWIESYGRASFDNPLYARDHLDTLTRAERDIARAGLGMKSGWLTSPTAGGQSWLAHGALASGLWTANQGRYAALIASGRDWLFHFAQEAGYRTSAVMPAITLAWPEKTAMGFDLVFEARDIPYEGAPFNWVTMPDQFTLAVSRELLPPDPRPDFMQIALISSHAPWTPVPDVLDWDSIEDGREFDDMAARGPAPRDLWQDRDDIRDAYRRAVDYSLDVVFDFVARMGEEAPLVIVAGDHQAAGFVAGSDTRDVAAHMIGPPELIARIDGWGWTEGLIPAADGPVRRMDWFRNAFLRAFTGPEPAEGDAS